MTPSDPMIVCDHLCKQYGSFRALDDLCLTVPRGELFCFLGPNGAGKTTTIRILAGLLRPSSGSIRIAGFDPLAHPLAVKKRLGYIPDMPYLYERLTTTEFFEFIGDLYDLPRETVLGQRDASFALFGLSDYRATLVGELSHGLRQRLIYAANFLHEPELLLVDEPLVGLDPYTIRLVKDLLRQKVRDGVTIFLTTHILAVAEEIGDRIGILHNGRLRALGSLDELARMAGTSRNLEDAFLSLTTEQPSLDDDTATPPAAP